MTVAPSALGRHGRLPVEDATVVLMLYKGEIVGHRDPRIGGAEDRRHRARPPGRPGVRRRASRPRPRRGSWCRCRCSSTRASASRSTPARANTSRRLDLQGAGRQARERAFELLYEAEAKDADPSAIVAVLPIPPDGYTRRPWRPACTSTVAEFDALITPVRQGLDARTHARGRPDLLRLATFELAHRPDVPTAVAIDEAVDLAKQFSTEESGRFVNGMLSRIAAEVPGRCRYRRLTRRSPTECPPAAVGRGRRRRRRAGGGVGR